MQIKKIRNITILLCIFFIFISVVCIIYGILPIREGMGTWYWQSQNIKVDRVDVSGIQYSDSEMGVSGEYLYCIAGNISCPTGSVLNGNDVSYQNVSGTDNIGTTYKYYCTGADGESQDISHVQCTGNLFYRTDNEYVDRYSFREEHETAPGLYDSVSLMGVADSSNEPLYGFTKAYNYIPLEINGDYVYLYNEDESIRFVTSPCFLYDISSNCINNYYNETDVVSEESTNNTSYALITPTTTPTPTTTHMPNKESCTNSIGDIPCLANNGAKVGDPYCCGQIGFIKDTTYNSPASAPYCIGYTCNSKWGTCSTTET